MSSVLRTAMLFFSIVPLQRWMNWIGVALIAFALMNMGRDGVMILAIPAAVLLGVVPTFCGGVALRYACTPTLLHLRPHGRARLLLGATLAITVAAAVAALPFQIDAWSRELGSSLRPPVPSVAFVFQIAWSVVVISWLCVFMISRSQIAYAMFGIFPVLVINSGRQLAQHVDNFNWVLPGAVLLWIAFAAWLMQTRTVARAAVMPSGTSSDTQPFGWLMNTLPPSTSNTTNHAVSLHLLGGSTSMFVANGIWIAIIFLAVHFGMGSGGRSQGLYGTLFMLPFLAFMFAAVGFTMVRRARMLWLRTGSDRSALFRQAEVRGLRAMLISWIIPTAAIVLAVAARTQRPLPEMLVFVLPAMALAVALFYGSMAMTRGLCVRDAVLALALCSLFVVELSLLNPALKFSGTEVVVAVAAAITGIALLRLYALRSWRRLDWRVAKMPAPTMRTT